MVHAMLALGHHLTDFPWKGMVIATSGTSRALCSMRNMLAHRGVDMPGGYTAQSSAGISGGCITQRAQMILMRNGIHGNLLGHCNSITDDRGSDPESLYAKLNTH